MSIKTFYSAYHLGTLISPKAELKILGLWIDGKLRWGPHIKETQALALTRVAASTWGATLNKARQVYTAVVRPAMTYGASVWHSPKDTRTRGLGPATKLLPLQNKCLRAITGTYKATNTKVLETESGIIPLDISLDQLTVKSRDNPRCSEIIKLQKAKIHRRLSNRRGRKRRSRATPMIIKDTWTKGIMDRVVEAWQTWHQGSQTQLSRGNIIRNWAKEKWKERWKEYLDTVTSTKQNTSTPSGSKTAARQATSRSA